VTVPFAGTNLVSERLKVFHTYPPRICRFSTVTIYFVYINMCFLNYNTAKIIILLAVYEIVIAFTKDLKEFNY